MTERDIERVGWSVTGVEGPPGTGWAYTIGLLESYGHPELVITGMYCFECVHATLNGLGGMVKEGRRLMPGDRVTEDDAEVRIGPVHHRHWTATDRFNGWHAYYGGKLVAPVPEALQVVTRSTAGTWQDDPANGRWRVDRLDQPPQLRGHRPRRRRP